MGIRDRLASHDARFISFSDLLTAIAEEEGVTVQEVARAWSLEGLFKTLKPVLREHRDGAFVEGGDDALYCELQLALGGGKAWSDDSAQLELRIGEPGFFRENATDALILAGWPIPARLVEQPTSPVAEPVPSMTARSDLLSYVPRVNIALNDAAMILGDAHSGSARGKWHDALVDAVDAGQIQAGTWSMDRGEQPLSHAHIRAWCEACGITWPVPLPGNRKPDAGTGDSELRAELDQARSRIVELEHERAQLQRKIEATVAASEASAINSPTFQRILDAVQQYPAWRAEWKSKTAPNLSNVEDWQKKMQGGARGGARLAYVAHIVIDEHFGLKT